jgi:hypothetical protein
LGAPQQKVNNMYRTVTVEAKVKLVMKVDDGVEIAEVIDEMDYQFDLPDNATLEDSEILGYEVADSR